MEAGIDFEELKRLDPELERLERSARAVRDPGGEYFCANHLWFDFKDVLRARLGAWRRPRAGEAAEVAEKLGSVEAFEAAFAALYPLLPPCRGCGCQLFEPYRQEDAALRGQARSAPRRDAAGDAG